MKSTISPKVSVCIPVYGVEKYIEKCARTLFEQTLQEIEYIFVDDCTPDRSMEILQAVLEEYPHRKAQVKIIRHEKNGGLVAARNTALKHISGEYVIHCDSDDWVELDMYESMYNKAKDVDADMVYCSYVSECPNNKKFYPRMRVCNDPKQFINLMYSDEIQGFLWNKLYKSKIALHETIACPDDIVMYEDIMRNTFMLPQCKKIVGMEDRFYHYIQRPYSICKQNDPDVVLKKIAGMQRIIDVGKKIASIDERVVIKRKCIELLWCVSYGNMSKYYKNVFPDIQKNISRIALRIDYKLILVVAKYSYIGAYILYFLRRKLILCIENIKHFINRE